MCRYNQPNTLFNLARETVCNQIVNKCKDIENRYGVVGIYGKITRKTYDNADCAALVHSLRDELLAILPPALCNDICESAISCHDKRKRRVQIRDKRILYGMLVNENLTVFRLGEVRSGRKSGIECVLPDLKNIVKLNLRWAPGSEEIIIALSFICQNLDHIVLGSPSPKEFRSLINECTKLRVIKTAIHHFSSRLGMEDIRLALSRLKNLEVLDYNNTAEALTSPKIPGPLKLKSLTELKVTRDNVVTAINKCPNLRELKLTPKDTYDGIAMDHMFKNLATNSNWKISKLYLDHFYLADENVESFFLAKGEYLKVLELDTCNINDIVNFVKFIGRCCKNLEKLVISQNGTSPSFFYVYNVPSDWIPSFPALQELHVSETHWNKPDDPRPTDPRQDNIKMITTVIAHSHSIKKVTLSMDTWCHGYPNDYDIQKMFPAERLKTLEHLEIRYLNMTKRMAEHILTNGVNLTNFVVPDNGTNDGTTHAADLYINKMSRQFQKNNRNFMFTFWDIDVLVDNEHDLAQDSWVE